MKNRMAAVKGRPTPVKNHAVLRPQFHWFVLIMYGTRTPMVMPTGATIPMENPAV